MRFSRTARTLVVCTAIVIVGTYAVSGQQSPAARKAPVVDEWPTYGHDRGGMRYSALTQITPADVGQLQPAWVYHMKPAADATPAVMREATEMRPMKSAVRRMAKTSGSANPILALDW